VWEHIFGEFFHNKANFKFLKNVIIGDIFFYLLRRILMFQEAISMLVIIIGASTMARYSARKLIHIRQQYIISMGHTYEFNWQLWRRIEASSMFSFTKKNISMGIEFLKIWDVYSFWFFISRVMETRELLIWALNLTVELILSYFYLNLLLSY